MTIELTEAQVEQLRKVNKQVEDAGSRYMQMRELFNALVAICINGTEYAGKVKPTVSFDPDRGVLTVELEEEENEDD